LHAMQALSQLSYGPVTFTLARSCLRIMPASEPWATREGSTLIIDQG
jgi:hypothetical protein